MQIIGFTDQYFFSSFFLSVFISQYVDILFFFFFFLFFFSSHVKELIANCQLEIATSSGLVVRGGGGGLSTRIINDLCNTPETVV